MENDWSHIRYNDGEKQSQKWVVRYRELTPDERTRDIYERREKARRDQAAEKRWAIKKREFEFAKKLLARNRPIDEIIEDTGLTREEIESLK